MEPRMDGRWTQSDAGPDMYLALSVPVSLLISKASHGPCTPDDFATAMHAMTISLTALRNSLGTTAFREQLWGTTGFVPPPQPPAPPSPPHPPPSTGSPGLSPHVLATVIAVPVGVCSLLLLLLAVIITNLRRNAKLQRSLLGHVLPPAAGDKATLVITDVQGSSKLWETLPAVVVEASMKLHDDLVRRLALDSSGYEWATEGDSFLLCFHSPQAAITFSTQLQGLLGLLTRKPGKEVSNTTFSFCEEEDGMKQASVSDHKESPEQWQPRLDQVRVGWQRLCELYKEVEVEAPAALTVLAGLRGLLTGLAADEVLVQRRMGASSITYGGAALVLAKAVQACAHGGQVTLSAATFVKVGTAKPTAQGKFGDNLPVEELRAAGISVVHMGQHLVALGEGKGATALELYCACLNTPDHAHRLWALGPLRTLRQVQPGVLHAPYGTAAIAFMSVVGLPQLKAWNADLAKECVALYQAAAQRLLLHVSGRQLPAGYWVSSAEEEGMVLAAFPCSLQCLHWALLTLTTCMDMDWPQALLDSLLGEEMTACLDTSGSKAGVTQAPATEGDEGQQQGSTAQGTVRLLRGLRLKAGVDVGEVACDLTPANGRFNYRGRCLNRAARINGLAVSGQIWCSETAWANTQAALQPPITAREARSLASLAADQPAASTASWSAQGSKQGKQEAALMTGPTREAAVLDVSSSPPRQPCSSGTVSSVTAQWHAAQQQLHSSTQAGSGAGGEGAERPSASLLSQGQPLCLPGLLPPLVARPLGKRELRGIPGQVALLQVALAPHTSRAQLEAADRLGLSAPGLQLSRPQQQADT
ncbi:nucleotide cyclase [Haematococcus lacustris]